MGGVLIGFGIIAFIIGVGYVVARFGVLPADARFGLARLSFWVLAPCLLFVLLSESEVADLFSSTLATSAIASVAVIAIAAVVMWRSRRLTAGDRVIGAVSAGYVNANNIGIPVSVYIVDDPAASAPVILFQLVILAPIALGLLDGITSGSRSLGRVLTQPVRNPIVLGSMLGVVVAVTGVEIPDPVMEPLRIIGAATVPIMLIGFGMSLRGSKPLSTPAERTPVIVASALKLAAMPLIALAIGYWVFDLPAPDLYAVTILAALPTAQNVVTYAQRYRSGETIARDVVFVTTCVALLPLAAIALLLPSS